MKNTFQVDDYVTLKSGYTNIIIDEQVVGGKKVYVLAQPTRSDYPILASPEEMTLVYNGNPHSTHASDIARYEAFKIRQRGFQ